MSLVRCTISGVLFGSIVQNVVHFDTVSSAMTLSDVATECYDNFLGHTAGVGYQHVCGDQVHFFQIKAEDFGSPPQPAFLLAISRSGNVASNTQTIPSTCAIMQIQTGTGGRHGRGRIYCPDVPIAFTDSGFLNSTFDSYANFMVPVLKDRFKSTGTGPMRLVVKQKHSLAFHAMENVQFARKVGTQRRRMPGVGI